MWDVKRIFKELADAGLRNRILAAFWKHADAQSKALALALLARTLNFREETLRKMPVEKKSELLASRLGVHEFDQFFEMALMQYHTHEKNEMMGAFLDLWNIPHANGTIEVEQYDAPAAGQVRDAVHQLESHFDRRDIALYLATAGLLMGGPWRDATWPEVEGLR